MNDGRAIMTFRVGDELVLVHVASFKTAFSASHVHCACSVTGSILLEAAFSVAAFFLGFEFCICVYLNMYVC